MGKKGIIALILLVSASAAYYYFFVDTLTVSEIVGETNDPTVDIFVNLFDFDTGLTRWDLYNLARKSDYWDRRINEVESIPDPYLRDRERQKLVAEMMRDPAFKKISRKLFGFGGKGAYLFLKAVYGFEAS